MAGDDEIERLRRAAALDPAARARLADLLSTAGRAAEAVAECRAGLQSRPEDLALLLALGRALSAEGELDEAQEVFARASAIKKRAAAAAPQRRENAALALGPSASPAAPPRPQPPPGPVTFGDEEDTTV